MSGDSTLSGAIRLLRYNPIFPHTGMGASISVDVKKNTEVSVGAEYQYDKNSKEWKMETSGRISIGF